MKYAGVVGGAITIISLAAFGIVQAAWWTHPASLSGDRADSVTPAGPPARRVGSGTPTAATAAGKASLAAQPTAAPPPAPPAPEPAPAQVSPNQAASSLIAQAGTAMARAPHAAALAATGNVVALSAAAEPRSGSQSMAFPAPIPTSAATAPICANPSAMGVARVVEIDTTGGPGFGFQNFKSYDFLRDHEVVLTFDDGPWPGNTPAVLRALADQCVRATFFPIGKHATYHPEILKQVLAAGHTVGSHTWSHADLQKVLAADGADAAIEEIEKGASAVHLMAGTPTAPFVRFPYLRHPPEMVTYLGQRNVAIFSTDIDSFDFKIKNPDQLVKSLTGKLMKMEKGIILMHDFQKATAIALPQLLGQLQKNGFKVVHMVPKGMLVTLPRYDEAVRKENALPTVTSRPTDSVVKTLSE